MCWVLVRTHLKPFPGWVRGFGDGFTAKIPNALISAQYRRGRMHVSGVQSVRLKLQPSRTNHHHHPRWDISPSILTLGTIKQA